MHHKNAIILFTKNPTLGKVKTRLAKTIGDEKALDIYKKLLNHTQQVVDNLNVDKFIFYSDQIIVDDQWSVSTYNKMLQYDGNLGERMAKAFEKLFSLNYDSVCIIGSDCFELNSSIVEEAFFKLKNNNAVIGPTLDGGYYLLGMNKNYPELFQDKSWSTETVYSETINDFKSINISYYVLTKLSDIDEEKDLPHHWK